MLNHRQYINAPTTGILYQTSIPSGDHQGGRAYYQPLLIMSQELATKKSIFKIVYFISLSFLIYCMWLEEGTTFLSHHPAPL